MNWIVLLAFNSTSEQLDQTKDAIVSAMLQDVGNVKLWAIDNGSTDGGATWEFLTDLASRHPMSVRVSRNEQNQSPIHVGNQSMRELFDSGAQHILGIPNDVVLPPNLYREFLRWPRGIVTGSMTSERDFPHFESAQAVSEHTPMAVVLIRKWAHDALIAKDGYFWDEGYFNYASDCDFALRLAACGIRGIQLDIQYWHSCSASWRLADPFTSALITRQADIDRSYFERKWGFRVESERYGALAGDLNFRGAP